MVIIEVVGAEHALAAGRTARSVRRRAAGVGVGVDRGVDAGVDAGVAAGSNRGRGCDARGHSRTMVAECLSC